MTSTIEAGTGFERLGPRSDSGAGRLLPKWERTAMPATLTTSPTRTPQGTPVPPIQWSRGAPSHIRSDDGPGFARTALRKRAVEDKIETVLIGQRTGGWVGLRNSSVTSTVRGKFNTAHTDAAMSAGWISRSG